MPRHARIESRSGKYNQSGHLFQDRFKSEAVENDRYFLSVLRYIHQNPLNAGLCNKIDGYRYSSYSDYTLEKSGFVDIDYALEMIDKNAFVALKTVGQHKRTVPLCY